MNKNIDIAQYIDHTLLKADSTIDDIISLCNEAIKHNFFAVCVNTCHVALATKTLASSPVKVPVKVAATVGFPLGAMHTKTKAVEAAQAVHDGASEIDMVINIGYLKSGMYQEVKDDMAAVKAIVGKDIIVKVILENCLLDDTDKKLACQLSIKAGVDFVKTSTGFTTGSVPGQGAVKDDLILMLEEVKNSGVKVKVAGGVKDYATAVEYINMGVARIGTSSGIKIISGAPVGDGY